MATDLQRRTKPDDCGLSRFRWTWRLYFLDRYFGQSGWHGAGRNTWPAGVSKRDQSLYSNRGGEWTPIHGERVRQSFGRIENTDRTDYPVNIERRVH